MIKWMLQRRRPATLPSGPEGSRAYAIGDVHGRLDLLIQLLNRIEEDVKTRPRVRKTYIITLGDLVDRGPDSKGVIDHLLSYMPDWAATVHLKGNHEEVFERVLQGNSDLVPSWLMYGGLECAESYGVSKGFTFNASPAEIMERVSSAVPARHKTFVASLSDTFKFGDYIFVHAGLRPGVPLADQSARDLRWIRSGFLDNDSNHGLMVVHGHTIVEREEEHSNRIAIDTGAYRTGTLTALAVEGTSRWFINSSSPA